MYFEESRTKPYATIFMAVFALTLLLMAVLQTPIGRILTSPHATDRHGKEAVAIREAIATHGPQQIRCSNSDPAVLVLCVDINRNKSNCPPKWGAMFVQKWSSLVDGVEYRERTSFCPAGGNPSRFWHYINKISGG